MCPLLGGSTVHKEEDNLSILDKTASPNESIIRRLHYIISTLIIITGMILMNMRYSSERQSVSHLLAPNLVDPENAYEHLLPYIACESPTVRETILNNIMVRTSN